MGEPTPLHVLLWVMRRKWKAEDYEGAVALAKIAAPYLHGKVPASPAVNDLGRALDEQLDRFDGEGGAGAAGGDQDEPA